jgi:hypothetical protein
MYLKNKDISNGSELPINSNIKGTGYILMRKRAALHHRKAAL